MISKWHYDNIKQILDENKRRKVIPLRQQETDGTLATKHIQLQRNSNDYHNKIRHNKIIETASHEMNLPYLIIKLYYLIY